MSNQAIDKPRGRTFLFLMLLVGTLLVPQAVIGQGGGAGATRPHPMLVRARPGDTPATLARRYLQDASKAWTIEAYNRTSTINPNDAILIPVTAFRPGGLRPDGFQTVPVLVYADFDQAAPSARRALAEAAAQQLQWLKNNGFTAVAPGQLLDFLNDTGQLPQRAILITADTESRWFGDRMAPLLREAGFTATVFVAAGRVGDEDAMTWGDLKRLQQSGFTIGCRGQYGRSLIRRKRGQSFEANFRWIEAELEQSKAAIEANLDVPCRFLAYPQGGTNGLIAAMAARIGYSAAFTQTPGDNPFFTDRFNIHRTVIDDRTDPKRLAEGLTTLIEADLQ